MIRDNPSSDEEFDTEAEIDLHGLPPERALRKLGQELHACRLRRMQYVLVITGRGWGNLQQKPVLRPMVEEWLRGEHGQRLGVLGYRVTARGGALILELKGAHSEHDHR